MLPVTDLLTYTKPIEKLEALSNPHPEHATVQVPGLTAARNETIEGIANHVVPSAGEQVLNTFLAAYDRNDGQRNLERLTELLGHGEMRWIQKSPAVIDNAFSEKRARGSPTLVPKLSLHRYGR